jgi:hypothetical protein
VSVSIVVALLQQSRLVSCRYYQKKRATETPHCLNPVSIGKSALAYARQERPGAGLAYTAIVLFVQMDAFDPW